MPFSHAVHADAADLLVEPGPQSTHGSILSRAEHWARGTQASASAVPLKPSEPHRTSAIPTPNAPPHAASLPPRGVCSAQLSANRPAGQAGQGPLAPAHVVERPSEQWRHGVAAVWSSSLRPIAHSVHVAFPSAINEPRHKQVSAAATGLIRTRPQTYRGRRTPRASSKWLRQL